VLNEAVILAGGRDASPDPAGVPDPLLPVAGRPFIDHLIWNVRRHGVRRVVFAVGRHAEQVAAHVGDGSAYGIEALHVLGDEALGDGEALAPAGRHLTGDEVLVVHADALFDINYLDLALLRRETAASVAVALREVDDVSGLGAVNLEGTRVTAFAGNGQSGPGLLDSGVYVVGGGALGKILEGAWSLETGPLAALAAEGGVAARAYRGTFVRIGVPGTFDAAQELVSAWRDKPAVFLDRDGVINEDVGYAHTPEQFRWMPGAREAVKAVNDAGWLAIVVTNQAGIGRGYYTEVEFAAFSAWIDARLAEAGAHLDATYFCPHHPDAALPPYRVACDCRKPGPGLILRAAEDWGVDLGRSVLVGDKDSDLAAAEAAGVPAVRYSGGDVAALVGSIVG
jgi:D,D-heptose 1,7-bisphosphate phosphatase